MRVVIANKYWHLKRGADRYALDLARALEARGHQVIPFSMQHPKNEPSEWSRFFVSGVETDRVRFTFQGIRTAARSVWSFEAARKFGKLLDETLPDVVHLHNIYRQLSPSIIGEARKRGIPVVMTTHDYALVAPNYSLFHDGAICEHTKRDRFFRAIVNRCVKHSYVASALVAFEMHLHRTLGVWNGIGTLIAPSRFSASLLAEYGMPEESIEHLPYGIDTATWQVPAQEGAYALYVGALSPEKDLAMLIRAAAKMTHIPVHVVGTGPDEARLKVMAKKLGAPNVIFLGFQEGSALLQEYAGARFLVVPSAWYEVFGLVVLEAYAAGKPVIATQIGGLGELVRDGETGLFASVGNDQELSEHMHRLWSNPAEAAAMGRAGRAWVEAEFTPAKHFDRLIEIYHECSKP